MEYKSVNNRCAVILSKLNVGISDVKILKILEVRSFKILEVNIIDIARQYVGNSQYKRGARMEEAPKIFDCSSFTKYLYAQLGIWIPRRSIQQSQSSEKVELADLTEGDLIFTSGPINYYEDDKTNGIGHVCIFTKERTIIHAANKTSGIIETNVDEFLSKNQLRGIGRYIPKNEKLLTLEIPNHRDVETSDDIRWIIRQSI